jgi:hypothetical protein
MLLLSVGLYLCVTAARIHPANRYRLAPEAKARVEMRWDSESLLASSAAVRPFGPYGLPHHHRTQVIFRLVSFLGAISLVSR